MSKKYKQEYCEHLNLKRFQLDENKNKKIIINEKIASMVNYIIDGK